jgi:hypothetical protein
VETTRRTPRGTSCSPVYGAKACLPPETLLDPPTSPDFRQDHAEMFIAEHEGSHVKRGWKPRVGT